MNVNKTSRRARQPRRHAIPALASKTEPKALPAYYARESLSGARLIRLGPGNSLANAPVLE